MLFTKPIPYSDISPQAGDDPSEMLKQFAREGVMGHPKATASFDNRWASNHAAHEVDSDGVVEVDDPEEWLHDIFN